jgi:antitoxin (DNA-binding transcriptional repressor) of toxin-antitoxin stability system
MKTIALAEADRHFASLVHEVEITGQPVAVLDNGNPCVMVIRAGQPTTDTQTAEADAALEALLNAPRQCGS